MKKLIAILVPLALVVCLVSCGNIGTYDDGFEDGYDDGYSDARFEYADDYSEGYHEGISRAKAVIESKLLDEMYRTKDGMYPEDAVSILITYADDPSDVSKDELYTAIWSIHRYYYDMEDAIRNLDDLWID